MMKGDVAWDSVKVNIMFPFPTQLGKPSQKLQTGVAI